MLCSRDPGAGNKKNITTIIFLKMQLGQAVGQAIWDWDWETNWGKLPDHVTSTIMYLTVTSTIMYLTFSSTIFKTSTYPRRRRYIAIILHRELLAQRNPGGSKVP
jgi:hypothetical protein